MPPNNYYDVPTECHLYSKKTQPEEEVRQWVMFELLSTYGYTINQIKSEVTVKYGTINCRADVVVYLNEKPFVVIECKRRDGYRKSQNPMAQAKSYAAAPAINAPYAVFTDGNKWLVEKLTEHGWVVYPDIPKNKGVDKTSIQLDEVLNDLHDAQPALYWYTKIYRRCTALNSYSQFNRYS
jgi:predicted type IV restriction endonuclease